MSDKRNDKIYFIDLSKSKEIYAMMHEIYKNEKCTGWNLPENSLEEEEEEEDLD